MIGGMGEVTVDGHTRRNMARGASELGDRRSAGLKRTGPERESQRLREQLIDAAVEVIAAGGYPRLRQSADSLILA